MRAKYICVCVLWRGWRQEKGIYHKTLGLFSTYNAEQSGPETPPRLQITRGIPTRHVHRETYVYTIPGVWKRTAAAMGSTWSAY